MRLDWVTMTPVFVLLLWAAAEDIYRRRIANWLCLSLLAAGLASSVAGTGLIPVWGSICGVLVGALLLFGPFTLGAVGGGDLKLLAAVGAWVGPWQTFIVFLVASLIGLLIVLIQAGIQGKFTELFRNSLLLTVNLVHLRDVGVEHVSATGRNARSISKPLPYAVPILFGMLYVMAAR